MTEQLAKRFALGPMDQVAYVVESLEASLPEYESLFGPFRISESPLEGCEYRGREVSCHLRLAVNNEGPLEIELIEVVGGEAPHQEHLDKNGEGLHHARFRVDDLDRKLGELEAAGFETIFRKRFGPTVAFAYVETPEASGRSVIELLQLPS